MIYDSQYDYKQMKAFVRHQVKENGKTIDEYVQTEMDAYFALNLSIMEDMFNVPKV